MQGGVETIKSYVDQFIEFAKEHTELFFYVTRIGCGIAGFKDSDIAPLFKESVGIKNICLLKSFYPQFRSIFSCEKIYMLRCLFGALYVDMRCFGVSWVFSKHKIPHPNQWVSMKNHKETMFIQ